MVRTSWCALALVCLVSCSGSTGVDGGSPTGGGSAATGGGGGAGGGGGGVAACVPLTCATSPVTCGIVSDGCGRSLNCGPCNCTSATFLTDCPARPCEVTTGCANNTCLYEPVTCTNFERCETCVADPDGGTDGGCADTALRACGSGCASEFCDPTPSFSNGRAVFANRCVLRTEVSCGLCGLSGLTCAADGGAATCSEFALPGVNPAFVECNGGSSSATVLFVDPAFSGSSHTGAREAPFLTLADAMSAAAVRGSRAIVIGGAPVFPSSLTLTDGVSLLGGFSGAPTWTRDPSRRPVFRVPTSELVDGRLVGLVATGITTSTVLANVDIVTANLTLTPAGAGASNLGAVLADSPGLSLVDVRFEVGDASPGADGVTPAAVVGSFSPAGVPGNSRSDTHSCPTSSLAPTAGGTSSVPSCDGVAEANGRGGDGASVPRPPNSDIVFTRGNAAPSGAPGGLASFTSMWNPGPGADGTPYSTPAVSGTTPAASFVWAAGVPVTQGKGGDGARGGMGRGGGGGGGGAASEAGGLGTCRLGAG
ncbi:MAG: hypothetical protein ACOZQL_26235, partial [Myxococcota bacterium]